jgi:hypothetical protein
MTRSIPARSAVHLLLWLIVERYAALKSRIYDIRPVGGPIFGDTAITLNGYGLQGVECIFAKDVPDPPPTLTAPCKFEPGDPDAGKVCVCAVPRAPQYSKVVEVTDPQTGAISLASVAASDLLAGPVVVTAAGVAGSDFSPFDVSFTYYELNSAVHVEWIEPTGISASLEHAITNVTDAYPWAVICHSGAPPARDYGHSARPGLC